MADARADFRKKTLEDRLQLPSIELRGKPLDALAWAHARGHRGQAALHGRRPRSARDAVPARHARAAALSARAARDHVRGAAVDDPPVRRLLDRRGVERFYRATSRPGRWGCRSPSTSPTHRGYDSDHPRVVGDVGKAGVAIDSVEDMKILFDGIPLDQMSVSMTMNGAVLPVLAGYIVAAEEQGVAAGASSPGPSRTTSSRSSWSATPTSTRPDPSMRIVADIIEYTARAHAEVQLDLDLRLPHAGGRGDLRCRSSPSRSPTAWSTCAPRCRAASTIDEFAPRLSFFFAIGMNFFMEIAKLRAARLLWAQLMQQFEPKKPRSA